MKVSIGSKIVEGPWGGGNLFVKNLSTYLIELGHEVIFDLSDSDIDLILLTDPRSRRESSSTFNHKEINLYKKFINPNVSVVQRINECDERKNTKNINDFYLEASECADRVVFVSNWLKNIYLNLGMPEEKSLVIMSGSDKNVFKKYSNKSVDSEKIKVVTHHWSSHKNKGFEVYSFIDKLINNPKWRDKLEFSYIGNSSSEFPLQNSKVIEPLSGVELAEKLSENNIYLTGSINEPSGNHHIEAALCGLPILYLDSGGIPEYCEGFGVSFNNLEDFEDKLVYIIKNSDKYKKALAKYPFDSLNMNKEYLHLFFELNNEKNEKVISSNKIMHYLFLTRFKFTKLTRKFSQVNLRYRIKRLLRL